MRSAVRRLLRDRAIVRGADKRLSIALSVDDLRALHTRLDADADRHARRVEHGRPLTATIAAVARKGADVPANKDGPPRARPPRASWCARGRTQAHDGRVAKKEWR